MIVMRWLFLKRSLHRNRISEADTSVVDAQALAYSMAGKIAGPHVEEDRFFSVVFQASTESGEFRQQDSR